MDRFNKLISPFSLDNIGAGANKIVQGAQGIGNIARGAGNELGYLGNQASRAIGGLGKNIGNAIGNAIPGRNMFQNNANQIKAYKKGGKVDKTGLAYLHKGEQVLNKKQTESREKALKNKQK